MHRIGIAVGALFTLSVAASCSSRSANTVTERDPDASSGTGGTGGGNGGSSATGGGGSSTGGSGGTATGGSAGSGGSGGSGGSAGSGGAACRSTPAFELSAGAGRSANVTAAWTGDGYAVAWEDNRDGNGEIYFARLDAQGNKLGGDVRITNDPGESAAPKLTWASSELGLAWYDTRDGNTEIYFARIDAAGARSGAEVRVTADPSRSEFPSIARTNTGYAVAWNDDRSGAFEIYFALLDGNGAKLGQDKRVSTGGGASASLAVGQGGFGVAWHSTRAGAGLQIYFARLDANGAPTGTEMRLSGSNGGGNASVASLSSAYAVAWGSSPGSGGEVEWVSVDASGAIVGTPVALSSSRNTAAFPSLIGTGSGYAIAWPDGRDGDREIYVAELDAGGAKRAAEVRASDDATASLGPALVKSSLGYGVAWIDDPTATTGKVRFAAVCH